MCIILFHYRCYVVLPRLTPEGYRVIICKMFDHDITKFKPALLFKGALMLSDSMRHQCHSSGTIIIFDLYGRTMAHVASVTFPMLRNVVHCVMVNNINISIIMIITISLHLSFWCFSLFFNVIPLVQIHFSLLFFNV